ncbi:MAG: c-di-GMP phosphodiesterase, partial [Leptospiraceae bacterium]|nr:c-di-GMP phosphodiesterase [Leptospiraceae bacterium]
ASSFRDQRKLDDLVNVTMMSALLCDIGQSKMKMPEGMGLSVEEYDYVKNHPLMSYMMLAHEPEIDPRVKRNVLCHHRPLRGSADAHTNNYPDYKSLIRKLSALEEKYRADPQRVNVANDIREQLSLLKADIPYDEDANILAVASEFASLTSKVPWRDAYSTDEAVRIMINNSYFTYSDRIVREFLDHVVMSLNENRKIIQEGDYIVVAAKGSGKTFFEVCLVTAANRYQSRPGIDRIATIYPEMGRSPKLKFLNFNLDKLRPDPRYAHYELDKDDSRHIVYYIHPSHDAKMYEKLVELTRGRPRRAGDTFIPPGQAAEATTSSESG